MKSDQFADLRRRLAVPAVTFDAALARYGWSWHQIARGEFPKPFTGLDDFQLWLICADPVLWCDRFLVNPDDPDEPWTLWDYQQESLRTGGNTLHECGAEVGKTREIIAYILWKAYTEPHGSGLVTAPMSIHLLEIIDALESQLAHNAKLQKSLVFHRKQPHHHLKFSNGFKLDFRPTGHDGEALRGVHVSTFAMIDEAAKIKNPNVWKEFWRSSKPGCVHKCYSTPDGDRSTIFYRLCMTAEDVKAGSGDGGLGTGEAKAGNGDLGLGTGDSSKNLTFKKFHWSKELMPAPFWTPERRRFYIDQYGGEDSPGFQQNVLGNWGDPENSVFPWHAFQRLLHDIPEYRCLKILVDDSHGEVSLYGYVVRGQGSEVRGEGGEVRGEGPGVIGGKPEPVTLIDRRIPKHQFDIRAELKSFFDGGQGLHYGGSDLGFSQDPTEIFIKRVHGSTHRLVARVQLKGVTYDQQAEAINTLDDVFAGEQQKMGWGVDFGNAGSAVVHILQGSGTYRTKSFEERLTGFQFGAAYDAVSEDGEVILDKKSNRPVRMSAKELSTDLLTTKMQRLELQYPYDPDIMLMYPNHTYRMGSGGRRIYKGTDDHVIDADRVLTLRAIIPTVGDTVISQDMW